VVVIGAGVGGLTAAALLLHAGLPVTVLEAHVYPGGSAGTFYHKGYRFDAGATLAGGFSPGGPHARLADLLGIDWPVTPVDPAWVVQLGEKRVTQWADPAAWEAERRAAFPGSQRFWRRQERLAEAAWQISSRPFPWPPVSPADGPDLARALSVPVLAAAPYALRTVGSLIPSSAHPLLRPFLDAQLLISAQTTAASANALYGSAALDLPRRGVMAVRGGIGGIARTLADWVTARGGRLLYRQPVERIELRDGRAVAVVTRKGLRVPCRAVVANLTPWGLQRLLGDQTPTRLRRELAARPPTWGAFMLYLGLRAADLPTDLPDHLQIVRDPSQPLGEGNSVFLSLSPAGEPGRAPEGMRAATVSTHTQVQPWWDRFAAGPEVYAEHKAALAGRVLDTLATAVPGIRSAVALQLPATPLTFQFYTRRPLGMVGGFPQSSLFRARSPLTGLPNVWLVGDSIFPGQSTAGVTLGAFRVISLVLRSQR
jgi:C-3',4' desaturase CrtD